MENLESIRGKIAAVLKEKGWSLREFDRQCGFKEGRTHSILRRSNIRLTAQEINAISSATYGAVGDADTMMPEHVVSVRADLVKALALYAAEAPRDEVYEKCAECLSSPRGERLLRLAW